ncbi:disease resistance protein RUN1-like [Rhodamnia argentea]|uniref:Disease resistance protein RUN1-like n=1 Tax=Rhodamnia argentea TaxID=178133 RepID=A0ABM3HPK6_9MYRT|nr:disease resistance protein RUN1-like [Rhodamnia argentea]
MVGVFLNFFYWLCSICSTNSLEMEREEPTPSAEDPTYRASSSSASPSAGDYEGGTKKPKGDNYEVFLSFRGEDTRKGFTDHLYTSLVNAGIRVFRDDNELRVGEEIGPELLCSITQSKISIPIFSENYTSSKWEIGKCYQCTWGSGRNVVKEWEKALKEVGSLKGWESEKIHNGHEGALVNIVVREVLHELSRNFRLTLPKELVGVDDRVQEIMSLIDVKKFTNTTIIGICGMGGIGKTTPAKVLYNNLSSQFEHRSFLTDIRETCARKGIECLQKQLICDIQSPYGGSNVAEGIGVIRSRFTGKKVLIVLDDVDDNTHLNALAGESSSFEAGSIVIITTRNKSILEEARASHIYQLKELPLDQSLILFSRHAFRKDSPQSDYEDISHDVVSTTGGLPLALEVIGSFLCGKGKDVWKDTLKKLEKVPEKKVQEKLRISYDTLDL